MAFKLVKYIFVFNNEITGVYYENNNKYWSESNIDHYATNYYEISNYKPKLLNGLSMAIL